MRVTIAVLSFCLLFAATPLGSASPEAAASSTPKAEQRLQHPAQRTLVVTATAYNSIRRETSSTPNYGAWGDRLRPGMKAIAVSRDLLRLGLTRGVRVKISGLPGTYRVLDKMARRWHRRIDIYMGRDVKAALRWGKRRVRIRWTPSKPKKHSAVSVQPRSIP